MSNTVFPDHLELTCGPVAAIDLALFAAASGDHNPLHLDAEVAYAAGFEQPVVHGMLTMAYAMRLFTDAFGASSVRTIQVRFVGVAKRGDIVNVSATLDKVEAALGHYDLRARTASGVDLLSGRASAASTIISNANAA